MRPVVGITAGFDPDRTRAVLHRGYPAAIAAAGGLPVVLPPLDPVLAPAAAEAIDGLMLSGGPDLDPVYFGAEPRGSRTICPERDRFELALLEQVVGRDKPILAICRGVQVLNVFAGGDLYQDLNREYPRALQHEQEAPDWYGTHKVRLVPGSLVARIYGCEELRVNTFHHQALRRVAPGFRASAHAADGVVEAVEAVDRGFVVGVQWHPERMWERDDRQLRLFRAFVAACTGRRGTE